MVMGKANIEAKIAVVRKIKSDVIVDALLAEGEDIKKKNLSAELLGKWPPFTHYIQTVVTANPHSYFSDTEITRIERFAQANDEGVTCIKPAARRMQSSLAVPESIRTNKKLIKEWLKEYKGDVSIVTGEAHYMIFDQEIYQAIANAGSYSESKAVFVAGPIVLVNDSFRDNKVEGSIVPLLGELRNLDLYYSNTRQGVHFRLGGNEHLYVEDPHAAAAGVRLGWFFHKNGEVGGRFRKVLENILRRQDIRKSEKPAADFLFLTDTELDKLKEACQKELAKGGKPYNECTKEDFVQIITKYHIL